MADNKFRIQEKLELVISSSSTAKTTQEHRVGYTLNMVYLVTGLSQGLLYNIPCYLALNGLTVVLAQGIA